MTTSIQQPVVDQCPAVQNPSGFAIHRGINLSHWLSQVRPGCDFGEFITRDDIALLAKAGFDHVRLPVDEPELWDEHGKVIESALAHVKNCIGWCAEVGFRVVLDLHILRSHHFNSRNNEGAMTLWTDAAAQDRFVALWEALSDYLREYPNDLVSYEMMNEPVAPEHEQWNVLINRAVETIRKREPDRVLVMGSNRWQQPFSFPALRVPAGDPNIILSVHTYHPYPLTHHKAPWSAIRFYTGPVQYPGQCVKPDDFDKFGDKSNPTLMARVKEERAFDTFNKDELRKIVQPAIDKAKSLNLQLYCNEFGCLPTVPRQMRLAYYNDITDIFREADMAWASWDYKGDFGIVPWDREKKTVSGDPDDELIKILAR